MPSSSTASSLSRYRPAVLFVTGLAAAYGIYLIQAHLLHGDWSTSSQTSLRRSNAVHRTHRRPRRAEAAQITEEGETGPDGDSFEHAEGMNELSELEQIWENLDLGNVSIVSSGESHELSLRLSVLPTIDQLVRDYGLSESEAEQNRFVIENHVIHLLITPPVRRVYTQQPSTVSSEIQAQLLRRTLLRFGFSQENADLAFNMYIRTDRSGSSRMGQRDYGPISARDDADIFRMSEDETAWRRGHSPSARGGQSLLNLLYHIAEDQARREGYVHRGVTCNSCGSMPIRGIRYRCANCTDFDLCETCESMQVHPKTHLFYKVRIPAPFLANPKQAQPVWYPGKSAGLPHSLPKSLSQRLAKETGYENAEIDAMWDQFKCLTATDWRDDPNNLRMAIDRKTFDKCFCPVNASRIRSPQLIYDRIFAFYDVNGDGLIGFEEFIKGLASLNNKNQDERLKRIYQGYDIDGDGFIDRRDFLRMFRAYYALTKDLTEEMILGLEDDDMEEVNARDVILGGQPISSIFATGIPPGMRSHYAEGKSRTVEGDLEIVDGQGVVRERENNTMERSEVIAEAAERSLASGSSEATSRRQRDAPIGDTESERNELLEEALGHGSSRDRSISWTPADVDGGGHRVDDGDEPEGGDKDEGEGEDEDDGDDVNNGDHTWPPVWVTSEDVEAALGNGELAAENVRDLDYRKKILTVANQRLEEKKQKLREQVRQKAWEDRWRRRRFYVDEEEGAVAPDSYHANDDGDFSQLDHDDEPVGAGESGSSSALSGSRPPSPRSRSSSKVRFRDYLTASEYETRSNPSTSSRSIPYGERWGAYEIPEPEKDIGREILYQVTQQGLNEMLDPLFREKEDLALEVLATREERKRFRHLLVTPEIDRVKGFEEASRSQDQADSSKGGMSAADEVVDISVLGAPQNVPPLPAFGNVQPERNLPDAAASVASSSGSSLPPVDPSFVETLHFPSKDGEAPSSDEEAAPAPDISLTRPNESLMTPSFVDGPRTDTAATATRAPTTLPASVSSATSGPYLDPTLPQNRPNRLPAPSPPVRSDPAKGESEATPTATPQPDSTTQSQSQPEGPRSSQETTTSTLATEPSTTTDNKPSSPSAPSSSSSSSSSSSLPSPVAVSPPEARLDRLRLLNNVEQEIKRRGGPGRLDFGEFYALMNGEAGRRLGFLASWVEMASF